MLAFLKQDTKIVLVHFIRFLHYGYQRALPYFGNNFGGLSRGAKSLNPRPTGGGGLFRAPPLVFLRYLLNRCSYHRQTCSTLSPNIFTHCVKILKSRVSQFGHKCRQSDVMFRRFRAKIRIYGNHRHGCSFKATINFLIQNDVELVGL